MKKLVIYGGGELAIRIASHFSGLGINVLFFTSSRYQMENNEKYEDLKCLGVEVFVQDKFLDVKLLVSKLGLFGEELHLSIGAPWIFNEDFLRLVGGKIYNIHGTGLPRFRGAANISWQIMMGCRLSSFTLHLVDAGIDTGDIVYNKNFIYPESCLLPIDYINYYIDKSFEVFSEVLLSILGGSTAFTPTKQFDHLSSYWPRLKTESNGAIDWSLSVHDLLRFIRAFDNPYPGAFTSLKGERVCIKGVQVDLSLSGFSPGQYGILYNYIDNNWFVACNGGTLLVPDSNFISANLVPKLGDRLVTPISMLEDAKLRHYI